MDRYYYILEHYDGDLEDILSDYDITPMDILQALDSAGMLDCEELELRMRYGLEEESDS